MKVKNLQNKLSKFNAQWHPHQIGVVDNMQVLLAKLQGEIVWHSHEQEDEMFHVLKGTLYIEFRDRTETIAEGEIIIVPKGVEHRPYTKNNEEVHVMLFESLNIKHTGEVIDTKTQTQYPKI